ncbi:MAG: hypothetical protein ACJ0QL_02245 [Parvicellaceae bacterium]
MRKYKINREDHQEFKLPSKKVMHKYKNFNKVQVKYNDVTKRNKMPLYKNRKLFLFLVLLFLLFYLIFSSELI